jgi:hypothetical protein
LFVSVLFYLSSLCSQEGFSSALLVVHCICQIRSRPGELSEISFPPNAWAKALSLRSLHLFWEPPVDDGGAQVTQYTVRCHQHGALVPHQGECAAAIILPKEQRDTMFLNLTCGVRYSFSVTATNLVGSGGAATSPEVAQCSAHVRSRPAIAVSSISTLILPSGSRSPSAVQLHCRPGLPSLKLAQRRCAPGACLQAASAVGGPSPGQGS